ARLFDIAADVGRRLSHEGLPIVASVRTSAPDGGDELFFRLSDAGHGLVWRELRWREQRQAPSPEPCGDSAGDHADNERGEPVKIARKPLVADEQDHAGEERESAEQPKHGRTSHHRRSDANRVQRFDRLYTREADLAAHQSNAPPREITE